MDYGELTTRIKNFYKYLCLYEESLSTYIDDFDDETTKNYFKSSKDTVTEMKNIYQKSVWFGEITDDSINPEELPNLETIQKEPL